MLVAAAVFAVKVLAWLRLFWVELLLLIFVTLLFSCPCFCSFSFLVVFGFCH